VDGGRTSRRRLAVGVTCGGEKVDEIAHE
jgi:hypothetical protein